MEIRRLAPGDRVLDYRILERLGEGGFGEVFRAEHEVLGSIVAIKVPRDATGLAALRHEGVVQSKLHHANIVATRELSISHDPPFVVMDYIDGDSLAELLRREGPMPWRRAVQVLLHAGRALEHAHQKGVVHGDVKPGNILVEPGRDGRVLLTDFGLGRVFEGPQGNLQISRSLELATSGAEVQGTIRYLAPELLRGESVDERADVYSFGVLIFETITGKLPEGREVPSDLVKHLPPELDQLFERTFARREKRPRTLSGVLEELQTLLDGGAKPAPVLAARPGPVVAAEPARLDPTTPACSQPAAARHGGPTPRLPEQAEATKPLRALPTDGPAEVACWRGKLAAARAEPRFQRWRDAVLAELRQSMVAAAGVSEFEGQGFDLCFGVTREGEPQHRVYALCLPKVDANVGRATVAEARRIFDLEKGIWEKEVTFWVLAEDVADREQVLWTFKSFCMGWWRRRRIVLQDVSAERLHASELGCDPRGNQLKRTFQTAVQHALAAVPRGLEPVQVTVRRPNRCVRGATWGAGLALLMTFGLIGSIFALEMATRSLQKHHQRHGACDDGVALVETSTEPRALEVALPAGVVPAVAPTSGAKSSGAVAPTSGAKSSGAVAPTSGAKSSGAVAPTSGAKSSGAVAPTSGAKSSGAVAPTSGAKSSGAVAPTSGAKSSGAVAPTTGAKGSGAVAPTSGAKSSGAVAPTSGAKSSGASAPQTGVGRGVRALGEALEQAQAQLRYF
ncbi:MAG: protein kinase [Planctomycetota bacterium]